ncbi:MAG: M1 family peptidase [Bacteroidetes bacterium]|jgi:aminopeptidase N|nr:M1 family peptidase [Bacteroidota bacterium]
MTRFSFSFLALVMLSFSASVAQDLVYESGGELPPELSSYNVHFYDLTVTIDPADSTISGSVETHVEIVQPTNRIVLALDPKLSVYRMMELKGDNRRDLRFERSGDHKNMVIYFPVTKQPGERAVIEIDYGGKPMEAANPPWDGGLVWAKTPSGEPWVGVASQTIGAWVWWPNKDHPSDRPDSVAINLTMPDHLVVASNGRSRGTTERNDGFKTWHWFVSTPINNYNITFNAAPYETLRETYTSTSGDEMEIVFWVLPEFITEGRELFPQFVSQMEFFERTLGPYPFRADKYGVAHAPYLGMEHQTLIAYGAGFEDGVLFGEPSKFDDLHQHELAHEWWGNLVTVWDWRDFWIHEGFGTYMQALYAEQVSGMDDYQSMIRFFKSRISSTQPVAPRRRMSTLEITRGGRGGDVYYKGAAFLHTLRNFIGDQLFFESLRRFAYPDSDMEKVVDGSHMRFATTNDYLTLVNQLTGDDLGWMFEVYLRHAPLPILVVEQTENAIALQWNTETGDFPMPVDVRIGDQIREVIPGENGSRIEFDAGQAVEIDPKGKLLMTVERRVP